MATDQYTVQFRGLSSHYKLSDQAKVSFRYSVVEDNFTATGGDWVGVFPENAATVKEALLSVNIEDPSRHHLCDGGLYKASHVTVNCQEFSKTDTGQYRVWYVSSSTGLVSGRSDTFKVCIDDEDYPSISFDSMGSQDAIKAMRSCTSSYIDAETSSSNPTH